MHNLLFTAGGGSGCELINRVSKDNVFFGDALINNIDQRIPKKNHIKIPYANQKNFVEELIFIVNKYDINYLIPCVDEELDIISKKREFFNTQVILPQDEFIKLFSDKFYSSKVLYKNGIGPLTLLSKEDFFNSSFGFVIKPRKGRGSRGIAYINSKSQIDAYLDLFNLKEEEIIIQERIIGQEYTVTMVVDNSGELRGIYPLRTPLKKGITIEAYGDLNKKVIELCQKVHYLFKGSNIYNIQLILDKNNIPYIVEINPRVSTTFCIVYSYFNGVFESIFENNKTIPCSYWSNIKFIRRWDNQLDLGRKFNL